MTHYNITSAVHTNIKQLNGHLLLDAEQYLAQNFSAAG